MKKLAIFLALVWGMGAVLTQAKIGVGDKNSFLTGSTDLYQDGIQLSSMSVEKGQKIKVTTRIKYKGSMNSSHLSSVYTSYYIICGNKQEYLGGDYSSLGADKKVDKQVVRVTIPSSCEEGYTFIYSWVDNKNGNEKFFETDEENNIGAVTVYIN